MTSLRAITTVALALLLTGAGAAAAEPAPTVKDDKDKIVLANADVTVWFHGKKPMLKVFPTSGDGEADGFEFKFERVVEFADENGDGIAQDSEVRAFLNLNPASGWVVETTTTATEATLALTLDAPLTLRGPADVELPDAVPQDRIKGNVSLVFHVFGETVDVPGPNGTTVPLETTKVKYDLAVNAWSWVDEANDRLALIGTTSADLEATGDTAAAVSADDATLGVVAWLPTAEATTGAATEEVDVVTEVTSEGGRSRIQHAFAASGYDSLLYDPVFGIASLPASVDEASGALGDLNPAPGVGAVAAAAVVGAAAFAARRRG